MDRLNFSSRVTRMMGSSIALLRNGAIFLLGSLLVVIAVACVAELAARVSARSFVISKIDEIERFTIAEINAIESSNSDSRQYNWREEWINNMEIYNLILDDIDHLSLSGAETPRQTIHAIRHRIAEPSLLSSAETQVQTQREQITRLTEQISEYEDEGNRLERALNELISRYEDLETTLSNPSISDIESNPPEEESEQRSRLIAQEIETVRFRLFANEDRIYSLNRQIEELQTGIEWILRESRAWTPSNFVSINYLIYLQSDLLMAILVISCGAIGAVFLESRSQTGQFVRPVLHGLLAGFVAFLVLKGGRFLFVVDFDSSQASFVNPYAAAFVGVLTGLFTEKAYGVLSKFVEDIAERALKTEK